MSERERLMTQAEMAEKYGMEETDIANALVMAGVKYAEMKGRKRAYREAEAVDAIRRLYFRRGEDMAKRAGEWFDRAEEIREIYTGGRRHETAENQYGIGSAG